MPIATPRQEKVAPVGQSDILIVDDTLANLKLLSQILTEHGHKVRAVHNGPRALAAAKAAPPDLILLDIMMPEMDGYQVCRHLKADESTHNIPILFISALDEVEDKVKAFTAGGVDYVTKPFQAEEVLARVHTHLALHNLTRQLHDANAELSRRLEELQERNEELDAFAHTAAHDLKSPMAVVVGYGNLLTEALDAIQDREMQEYVQIITQTSSKMAKIVNELLLLASVRKTDEILSEPLDTAAIVSAVLDRLGTMIAEHQAEIVTPEQWPSALGHAPWVEEVWANLISNAIKYGGHPDEGSPARVELGADQLSSLLVDQAMIRFWVRDNGPGLTIEEQKRLFTEFTRLHQVRIEGHGLGLSIVQRIVKKLGGQVSVDSAVGRGSVFYFTLPAALSQHDL